MAVAGVVVVALGALAAATSFAGLDHRVRVLVVARDVHVGHRIGGDDVFVARVGADEPVRPILASQRRRVVGKLAAVELRAGMLLMPEALTDTSNPGPGQVLMGVAVRPGQMPAQGLHPGDPVLVVQTPEAQDSTVDAASPVEGTGTRAQVFDVGSPDADGAVIVDVVVGQSDGGRLAQIGAAGRLAILLLPAGS